MRIVTWNCSRNDQHTEKWAFEQLSVFEPDVAVIQECAKSNQAGFSNCLTLGDNVKQDIAVIVANGYKIETLARLPNSPRYCFPVQIKGHINFNVLAIWAQPDPTYTEAVVNSISLYKDFLGALPSVVIGDFNMTPNAKGDSGKSLQVIQTLQELGLASSYHTFNKVIAGQETHPTLYWQWNQAQPFHVDYCFVHQGWAKAITQVSVGSFEDWKERSDHRPLFVEVAL